ncbi:Dr family non-fimbrial adhesin I structural subunit NfaA [Escherichia coli]|uniref:Dr family non-fimbrial adhesin I structural subunit NfaA n=1 Tax=Escherichia coli TaxID=562 RepID=UPI001D33A3D7|nr:Dr family non-fimbrial adhesin I structural subunit NfaA [Escherichia coli]EHZ3302344.1 Dr family non-fimbrial adhesin I structural subunit NfaA [Escherichia coli]ELK6787825.1 Dr family non-fimbrial adhesin I structural subunit NfaA [Escherichia coli]MDL6387981.1 Dr family non-fimbrial adhesin I structural subunit NfaA [Escherichia coli]WHD17213.1 Dr family non-fimbrial adhesin I structural subunit NfaA [Escherichia coli]HCX4794668.1 Dr family non-fimbrial adhesin I structural subunit NfaA 
MKIKYTMKMAAVASVMVAGYAIADANGLNTVNAGDGKNLGTATATATITTLQSCSVDLNLVTPNATVNRAGMLANREITKFSVGSKNCPSDTYAVWFKEIDGEGQGVAQGTTVTNKFYLKMTSADGTASVGDINIGTKSGKGLSGQLVGGKFDGKITVAYDSATAPADVYTYDLMAAVYVQ